MATIKYRLHSKSENAPIYLRFSINRKQTFEKKTGLHINPKNWSKETSIPKQNFSENKNLTSKLRKLKAYVLDQYDNANSNGESINSEWLSFKIDVFFKRVNENKQSELITDAIQSIIDNAEVRKNAKGGIGLSKSRINAYKSLKKIFTEYQKTNSFKVKEVNVKFANVFLKYLLNDKEYSSAYALKKIADLKTVCYDAELEGIETHPQLKKIESTKSKNENIIYLTPLELKKIEDTNIISESLKNARKWLLLGCNIGQRGGDLLNIDGDNFKNRSGLEVIEITQQKTNKNVTIPVLETTKKILETGLPYKISLQKLNEHIKNVCKIAEIDDMILGKKMDKKTKRKVQKKYEKWELITSHICRRSFATNQYGILPTPLIMQITAHSTEKMFLNYIGKNSLDYAQQIADFYELQRLKAQKKPQLTIIEKAKIN